MRLNFSKYDGAGNDFILIDCTCRDLSLSDEQVAHLCDRRFGIGADGLMMLMPATDYDFEMLYYNSDGHRATMCGNGGRCITAFAHTLPQWKDKLDFRFKGPDGEHRAQIKAWSDESKKGLVNLSMHASSSPKTCSDGYFVDTGSPHFLLYVEDLDDYNVLENGRRWRHNKALFPNGTNVDFIEQQPDGSLKVRTFERGVEDETYSCGTGVVASALTHALKSALPNGHHAININTKGGMFTIKFQLMNACFSQIELEGTVSLNFTGVVEL